MTLNSFLLLFFFFYTSVHGLAPPPWRLFAVYRQFVLFGPPGASCSDLWFQNPPPARDDIFSFFSLDFFLGPSPYYGSSVFALFLNPFSSCLAVGGVSLGAGLEVVQCWPGTLFWPRTLPIRIGPLAHPLGPQIFLESRIRYFLPNVWLFV